MVAVGYHPRCNRRDWFVLNGQEVAHVLELVFFADMQDFHFAGQTSVGQVPRHVHNINCVLL